MNFYIRAQDWRRKVLPTMTFHPGAFWTNEMALLPAVNGSVVETWLLSGCSCTSQASIQIHSLSLASLALPGFSAVLQSRTVLDSRNGDYPPWSFHRQEIVGSKGKKEKKKQLPQGLTTSELTDGVSMNQGREKSRFHPFWPATWLERRGESVEADAWPVAALMMCAPKTW